jgi:S-methylmethionine-dependent homocysteine/selenocysteine methylase
MTILERLAQPRPILLDGATGTELARRAVDIGMPLWSARALISAPHVLSQIHADYLRAGAEIITANTFRTHRRSLAKGGLGDHAQELTQRAVELARLATHNAANGLGDGDFKERFVAGSIAPLEDCYSPQLVPPDEECRREHAEMARNLAEAGADLLLVETMNTIREAVAATRAACATGLPVITSFVCRDDGRLFSGQTVTAAVEAIVPLGVAGVCINCTPSTVILTPFSELRAATRSFPNRNLVIGLYANIGKTEDVAGWTNTADVSPLEYARQAAKWLELGAHFIGGCCGTTPAHIAALRMVIS